MWHSNSSTSPYLVADGIQPDSVAEWVVVQGESGGLTSTDSIPILPPPVAVTFAPPEIPPGDTADIILKERNPDGTTADFPPDQLFEVGISSGNSYGTILSSGDTAGYFASVPQGLKFIAVDSIRADSAMVGVQVEPAMALPSSAAPGRKGSDNNAVFSKSKSVSQNVRSPSANVSAAMAANGRRKSISFTDGQYSIGWVKIMEKENCVLKILNHAPWSVWPYLPPTSGGTTRGGDLPHYNPIRTFDIQVTDASGQPVKGASVEIIHNYQQGTGGHSHGASGDVIPGQPLQGIFYGQGGSGPSLELTTDENGMAFVNKYLASQISGVYVITAYLKSDPSVKDTVNLNVQVPGLVNFRDLIFLPKDEEPDTFSQTPKYGPNHRDNDWCTPVMGDSLFAGILDFNFWSASKKGRGIPLKVSINDMSLPWGGAFDYKGTWNVINEHAFHRVGLSVDINRDGLSDAKIRKLTEIMRQYGGLRNPEEPIHYGFFNGGN